MRNAQRLQAVVLVLVFGATGCGASSSDEESASSDFEGVVRNELTTGSNITIDDFSGIVRFGQNVNGVFTTSCTGVLWTNDTAITANCTGIGDLVRTASPVAGSQSASVLKVLSVIQDVQMVRLSRPFQVWNTTRTSHLSTGYNREIVQGSDEALEGERTRLVSIPPGANLSPTTATGILHFAANVVGDDMNVTDHGNSILTSSDIGAPCFDGTGTNYANALLDAVVSRCVVIPSLPPVIACRAAGAEQWYETMALTLLNGW